MEQSTSRCPCTAVVHHSSDVRKQPFVWTISKIEDVRQLWATEITPSSRNNGTYSACTNSFQDRCSHRFRVVNDNAAEPDINRGWSSQKKSYKVRRGCISWRITEEEAAYICPGENKRPITGMAMHPQTYRYAMANPLASAQELETSSM